MKKFLVLLQFPLLILTVFPLSAESYNHWHIGTLEAGGQIIAPATQHVSLATANCTLSSINYHPQNYQREIAQKFSLSYSNDSLHWHHNRYFTKKNFSYLGLSADQCLWRKQRWKIQGHAHLLASPEEFSLKNNALGCVYVDAFYRLRDNLLLETGLGWVGGLGLHQYFPLVGFQWNKHRFIAGALFPVELRFGYVLTPCWNIFLKERTIYHRHRIDKHAALSRGIWRYEALGSEVALEFKSPCKHITASASLGLAGPAKLKVLTEHGHAIGHQLHLHNTYYGSLSLAVQF